LTEHDPVAALACQANPCVTKLDGTTLLADKVMLIASECGVLRATLLVPEPCEDGVELIERPQDPIGLEARQQGITKLEAQIHRLSEGVESFRQFFQDLQGALKKPRSILVGAKRVRLET